MGGRRVASVAGRAAVVVLAGVAAALVMTGLSARVAGGVGPGKVALDVRPQLHGRTQLQLPPVGSVTASTHETPVLIQARIDEVDIEAVQGLLRHPDPEERLAQEVRRDLQPLLRDLAARCLAVAAVAGAVGALLVPRRRWWHALVGAGGGITAIALLAAMTWRQFEVEAFGQPRFEGAIERAPAILSAARRHVQDLEQVRDRVRALGDQVADLYTLSAQSGLAPAQTGDTRILHVSDIHSNPLGVEVARRLAESFRADAILDTGDLTTFGYPIEARVGDLIKTIPVPYLLAPGNHDSAANRAALAGVPNVTVLDGQVATVGGVRIMGVADPSFTASNEVSATEAAAIKLQAAPAVAQAVASQRPDVLAVHDRRLADKAVGLVPLVVVGHTHQRSSARDGDTLMLTVGSTGATGLGSFTVETRSAYEAQVLHFRQGKLEAVDYVSLKGISGEFVVERQLTNEQ